MIKISLLIASIVLMNACSFQAPQNQWQHKSASAFKSYKKNFLSNNDALAKSDLTRAIAHAKQSADFTQLATIYLGVCSLNLANGVKDECRDYQEIADLVRSKELESYFKLISDAIESEDIKHLPKEYQAFAQSLIKKDYTKANEDILNIQKPSSAFVAAALLKEHLETKTREYILDKASYNGYKKTVIFWLKEILKHTKDEEKIQKLQKKLFVLQGVE